MLKWEFLERAVETADNGKYMRELREISAGTPRNREEHSGSEIDIKTL